MGRYRVFAVVIASGLAAGGAHAQPAPDFDHAKQLYVAAEAAMSNGHYEEAVNDFGGAYEITKDAVLFYKIGVANQKLGKCDVALVYFGRYLKEAHPTEKYVQLTQDRIAECNAAALVVPPQPDGKPTKTSPLGTSTDDKPNPVTVNTNDEIGDLARALERMRVSLGAALERLRRREAHYPRTQP